MAWECTVPENTFTDLSIACSIVPTHYGSVAYVLTDARVRKKGLGPDGREFETTDAPQCILPITESCTKKQ